MRIKILGSAAGGAFPQWNCACPNCRSLRAGTFQGKARSQTQVAISADNHSWFLLGASPDLRSQIESTPELQPQNGIRQSPIAGAVLANADIDHVLGLLLLRELQPLRIHATASIRRILREDNSMFAMLQRLTNQASWTDFAPGETFPLKDSSEKDFGLRFRALSLAQHFPAYVSTDRQQSLRAEESSLGFIIDSPANVGRTLLSADASAAMRLAYMPAVPKLTDELLQEFDNVDLLLLDGTFWSDDELIRIQGSGQTARQMGHVPVSGPEGTLVRLAHLRRPRKIYLHINNTNPMLNEAGPEYSQVRDAGWEIAEDGWQFDL
ncbi:MAG: pyrroloquinoline quinone biosynthesis protein PqqB [Candidatus Sulfotelmatobacter sp.]